MWCTHRMSIPCISIYVFIRHIDNAEGLKYRLEVFHWIYSRSVLSTFGRGLGSADNVKTNMRPCCRKSNAQSRVEIQLLLAFHWSNCSLAVKYPFCLLDSSNSLSFKIRLKSNFVHLPCLGHFGPIFHFACPIGPLHTQHFFVSLSESSDVNDGVAILVFLSVHFFFILRSEST